MHIAQWMVRPIVDAHGWDHESGIQGFSVDKAFVMRKTIPANVSGQVRLPATDAAARAFADPNPCAGHQG